jgi:hypothetical protein
MQVLVSRRQDQVISALVNFDLQYPLREVSADPLIYACDQ